MRRRSLLHALATRGRLCLLWDEFRVYQSFELGHRFVPIFRAFILIHCRGVTHCVFLGGYDVERGVAWAVVTIFKCGNRAAVGLSVSNNQFD